MAKIINIEQKMARIIRFPFEKAKDYKIISGYKHEKNVVDFQKELVKRKKIAKKLKKIIDTEAKEIKFLKKSISILNKKPVTLENKIKLLEAKLELAEISADVFSVRKKENLPKQEILAQEIRNSLVVFALEKQILEEKIKLLKTKNASQNKVKALENALKQKEFALKEIERSAGVI